MEIKEAIKEGILENKIVRLKPIKKAGKMISDPKHYGYFMFNGAFKNYPLPRNPNTGAYKPILNEKELEYFNSELRDDLSFNRKENNFWDKYAVRIVKDEALMTQGKPFDLSDPWQNLDYRIMMSLNVTAPSYAERNNNPKYIWYFAEENEELMLEAKKTAKTQEVWTFFGTIMNSKKKMIDLLSVYFAEKSRENEVDINKTNEWLTEEIKKVITKDPEFILDCKENGDYEFKALITNAVRAGAIKKVGRNRYELEGDSVKYDFLGLVKLLKKLKDETDDDYLRIIKTVEEFDKQYFK